MNAESQDQLLCLRRSGNRNGSQPPAQLQCPIPLVLCKWKLR